MRILKEETLLNRMCLQFNCIPEELKTFFNVNSYTSLLNERYSIFYDHRHELFEWEDISKNFSLGLTEEDFSIENLYIKALPRYTFLAEKFMDLLLDARVQLDFKGDNKNTYPSGKFFLMWDKYKEKNTPAINSAQEYDEILFNVENIFKILPEIYSVYTYYLNPSNGLNKLQEHYKKLLMWTPTYGLLYEKTLPEICPYTIADLLNYNPFNRS